VRRWVRAVRDPAHVESVGRKRVERIMRTHGLQGAHLRRGWKHGSTRQNPHHTAAPDPAVPAWTLIGQITHGRLLAPPSPG
jgi:hypothetical protein